MHQPPDPIDLLTRLVQTPSISREEAAIADLLDAWLRDQGLSTRRIDNNVLCEVCGDAPGPTFLLNSHLDTVPPAHGWKADPWTPFIDETPTLNPGERPGPRLVGLGSGDAKASVAAMACAITKLARQGLPRGKLLFVASVMEEIGRGGMDTIRPMLGHIDAGMIGEPTSLQAATSQSGLIVLDCTAKGRASHAARAHLGVNALTIAARDILKIADWRFDRVHPQLGQTTVNATIIKGGDRHNVIPDRCEYTLDIRSTPAYAHEEIIDILKAQLEAEVGVRSLRLRSVETLANGRLIQSLQAAYAEVLSGEALVQFGSPTMSDWAHLRDIEGVKFGPGDSPRSHTADESVNLSEVRAAVDLYLRCASHYLAES